VKPREKRRSSPTQGCSTIGRRRSLRQDNEICESYNLQIDELPHGCDVSLLLAFIRMAFIIGNIKEELMKTVQSHYNIKVNAHFKAVMLAFCK
jgi:hypothetical protein